MDEVHDVELKGCSPVPLANYLKALGVLRTIVEDRQDGDPEAKGFWNGDLFHIISRFEKQSLLTYFLMYYKPTPILSPWNGRGGFLEGEENDESARTGARMIQTFRSSRASRFSKYVNAIDIVKRNVTVNELNRIRADRKNLDAEKKKFEKTKKTHGLDDNGIQRLEIITEDLGKKSKEEKLLKTSLLYSLRSTIPDNSLAWIDACLVLTGDLEEKASMSPLLGTGGVDGSQDFSVNFMHQLTSVISVEDGVPKDAANAWLRNALFLEPVDGLRNATIGQFHPSAVGGANAISGFESGSLINPWDYIFMIEGALLFAAASVRQLGANGPSLGSFPFTVGPSGVGYGSASNADEKSRHSAEIWVPLWEKPTCLNELSMLMGEGRAQIKGRAVRNGVDFIRAVAGLGVDRGINAFQRYGFLERNGHAYFAVSHDRIAVCRQPQVDLLSDIDAWLVNFRSRIRAEKAPASFGRSLRNLDSAIFNLSKERGPSHVQDVLISLGRFERALSKNSKWAKESFLRPVPALSDRWLKEADDGSSEFRLAASLASVYGYYSDADGKPMLIPLRLQMEPVHTWLTKDHLGVALDEDAVNDVVWSDGDIISALNRTMNRRIMKAVQSGAGSYPDKAWINADIGDITDFIEGRVDLTRMEELLWGLILLDWPAVSKNIILRRSFSDSAFPAASYGLLKLCFSGQQILDSEIPLIPEIHRRAVSGDGFGAMLLAERRLRGSGISTVSEASKISAKLMKRTAAALLFPIGKNQVEILANKVQRPELE
jgi:CRISPR-associated protein Csx17